MATAAIPATMALMAGTRTESGLSLTHLRARGLRGWQAAWLCLCLLLAQHVGLAHRVEHGGLAGFGLPGLLAATVDSQADDDAPRAQNTSGHSCVLFDSATMADLHCGAPPPVLAYGKPVNPAALAWRWPDLPPRHPFRSRAPPAQAIAA